MPTYDLTTPREGCDECDCGSKYWDRKNCHSCGEPFIPVVPGETVEVTCLGTYYRGELVEIREDRKQIVVARQLSTGLDRHVLHLGNITDLVRL
jgi:hypothetical protein